MKSHPEREYPIHMTFRDICELLARHGILQSHIALAAHCDEALLSKWKHGHTVPEKERAMQVAESLRALMREHGISEDLQRDYVLGWLISLEHVPRSIGPSGRLLVGMLADLTVTEQGQTLKKFLTWRKEILAQRERQREVFAAQRERRRQQQEETEHDV